MAGSADLGAGFDFFAPLPAFLAGFLDEEAFLAGAFLAAAFLAGAFLATAFLATAFLAGAFLATFFTALGALAFAVFTVLVDFFALVGMMIILPISFRIRKFVFTTTDKFSLTFLPSTHPKTRARPPSRAENFPPADRHTRTKRVCSRP
jgi:hypothetical protein